MEDNMKEFKQKIAVVSGVPYYRQHLFYIHDGLCHPVNYNIVIQESIYNIDIRKMYKSKTVYEGLRVDTGIYEQKDELVVTETETNTLFGDIYEQYKIDNFYIVDLNDFINPIRPNLVELLSTDLYSINYIYYSFIVIYWPQISLSIFSDYLINENEMSNKYPFLVENTSRRFKKREKYSTQFDRQTRKCKFCNR